MTRCTGLPHGRLLSLPQTHRISPFAGGFLFAHYAAYEVPPCMAGTSSIRSHMSRLQRTWPELGIPDPLPGAVGQVHRDLIARMASPKAMIYLQSRRAPMACVGLCRDRRNSSRLVSCMRGRRPLIGETARNGI